jgi:hypothetical protein
MLRSSWRLSFADSLLAGTLAGGAPTLRLDRSSGYCQLALSYSPIEPLKGHSSMPISPENAIEIFVGLARLYRFQEKPFSGCPGSGTNDLCD